jgi:hypothetical protein
MAMALFTVAQTNFEKQLKISYGVWEKLQMLQDSKKHKPTV